jgi:DNA helicase-2/ATP-dependent DNA helicase PcrA
MDFSKEQHMAIASTEPRLLVSACPGAGKTTVLTERLARLIRQSGLDPKTIVAMTFTKRAAEEMRTRLLAKVGEKAKDVRFGTIHSVCLEIVRRLTGSSPDLADTGQVRQILEHTAEIAGISPAEVTAQITLSRARNQETTLTRLYQEELRARGLWDFDDLLTGARRLLLASAKAEKLPWLHILVDEGQDLNPVQRDIVAAMANRPGATLFLVGDPDQAIYGFRGADHRLLTHGFEGMTSLRLSQNWRSGSVVVKRASRLASAGFVPARDQIGRVEWFQAATPQEELQRLVAQIKGEAELNDVAVLARTNGQALGVAMALREAGIPVLDEDNVFDLQRYRGLNALMAVIYDPRSVGAQDFFIAARVVDRYLGKSFKEALEAVAAQNGLCPWDALDRPLPRKWMARGAREFKALVRSLRETHKRTQDVQVVLREAAVKTSFLDRFNMEEEDLVAILRLATGKRTIPDFLRAMDEFTTSMESGVRVITVHRAKGLEFPVVYLPSLNVGTFPHRLAESSGEERRLLYVAVTRAKDKLVLSWAKDRPSPFLADLGLPPTETKKVLWFFTKRVPVPSGAEGQVLKVAA